MGVCWAYDAITTENTVDIVDKNLIRARMIIKLQGIGKRYLRNRGLCFNLGGMDTTISCIELDV